VPLVAAALADWTLLASGRSIGLARARMLLVVTGVRAVR
jgi:hypothetical protein